MPDDGSLPDDCWRRRSAIDGIDVLKALPAYIQRDKKNRVRHEHRRALAAQVLDLSQARKIDQAAFAELIQKHGIASINRFIGRLPEDAELRLQLETLRDQSISKLAPAKKESEPPLVLPEDFATAVKLWHEHSQLICETHIDRGGRYSAGTVARRVAEARRFCAFLTERGVCHWPEVSQRYLDLYIADHSHKAAQHAFTFLQFVRKRFRLTHRFVRPVNRPALITERLLSRDEQLRVARQAVAYPDPEPALATLLVTLYAQTVTASRALRLNQLMRTSQGISIRFAETWLPLDELTAGKIEEVARRNGLSLPQSEHLEGDDFPLLIATGKNTLIERVIQIAGCSVKRLRLSAVATIIKSGYTSRGSISRALGVSMVTVKYVEGAFPWDLQESVPEAVVRERNQMFDGAKARG